MWTFLGEFHLGHGVSLVWRYTITPRFCPGANWAWFLHVAAKQCKNACFQLKYFYSGLKFCPRVKSTPEWVLCITTNFFNPEFNFAPGWVSPRLCVACPWGFGCVKTPKKYAPYTIMLFRRVKLIGIIFLSILFLDFLNLNIFSHKNTIFLLMLPRLIRKTKFHKNFALDGDSHKQIPHNFDLVAFDFFRNNNLAHQRNTLTTRPPKAKYHRHSVYI